MRRREDQFVLFYSSLEIFSGLTVFGSKPSILIARTPGPFLALLNYSRFCYTILALAERFAHFCVRAVRCQSFHVPIWPDWNNIVLSKDDFASMSFNPAYWVFQGVLVKRLSRVACDSFQFTNVSVEIARDAGLSSKAGGLPFSGAVVLCPCHASGGEEEQIRALVFNADWIFAFMIIHIGSLDLDSSAGSAPKNFKIGWSLLKGSYRFTYHIRPSFS